MKLCPHCSASLEENAAKCPSCEKWVVPIRETSPPPRTRKGLKTRILVLGLLGFLAWVVWAMPEGYRNPREILELEPSRGEILGTLRADLETMVRLQDEYHGNNGAYSGNTLALGFTASEGAQISIIATPTGWSATARHGGIPPEDGCAVFGGSSRPPQSPILPDEPGEVRCTEE